MRKLIAKTLIICILAASLISTPAYADSATVTGDFVNFRSGPGLSYSVISCLRSGTSVTVLGVDGSWTKISFEGDTGYISSQYLSATSVQTSETTVKAEESLPQITPEIENDSGDSVDSSSKSHTIVVQSSPSSTSGTVFSYGSNSDNSSAVQEAVQSTPAPTATVAPTPSPSPSASTTPSPTPSSTVAVKDSSAESSSKSGTINGDYVRFRTGPSTTYKIIASYNKGKALTIIGTSGDWTKCVIDGTEGYVFSQYVKETVSTSVEENVSSKSSTSVTNKEDQSSSETTSASVTKAGYICGNNVRFRKTPSLEGEIIGEFYFANSVTITGTSGDWTAVAANGKTGYVYSQYVKEGSYTVAKTETSSASGQAVVDYAMQYLGTPYKWGGTDPSGFDCSGFVYYVYKHFNVTLNRVAQDQASNGAHVDASDLQPGDILLFYSGSNYIGHAGIYIGDDKFIHSATSNTGVIITSLSGYYTTRGFEARRILS